MNYFIFAVLVAVITHQVHGDKAMDSLKDAQSCLSKVNSGNCYKTIGLRTIVTKSTNEVIDDITKCFIKGVDDASCFSTGNAKLIKTLITKNMGNLKTEITSLTVAEVISMARCYSVFASDKATQSCLDITHTSSDGCEVVRTLSTCFWKGIKKCDPTRIVKLDADIFNIFINDMNKRFCSGKKIDPVA